VLPLAPLLDLRPSGLDIAMKSSNHMLLQTMGALLGALASMSAAALELGQRLTPQQIGALPTQTVTVAGETLRVVSGSAGKSGVLRSTLVINSLGAVGESRHEVLVSQVAPSAVRSTAAALRLPTVASSFFEQTGISALRFATFEQAVQARDQLARQLPRAAIAVPVQYSELRAR